MKLENNKSFFIQLVLLMLMLASAGCSTANLVDYSSIADREQRITATRTEMSIVRSDGPKISRDYTVISAIDYMSDGKKNYYLIIVPVGSGSEMIADISFQNEYPYIIQGKHLSDIVTNLDKCANEWDMTNVKYSGAVYNIFIASPDNSKPYFEMKSKWYEEKKYYQIYPYIKFNYSKNEKSAKATLALGNRVEQVVYAGYEGKVKGRTYIQDDEKVWVFSKSVQLKDFQMLLSRGLLDLRSRGMDGYTKKSETKAEVKEVKETNLEVKPAIIEKKTKKTRKKKRK